MAEDYVCTLNARSLKRAQEQLNENSADRMHALDAFRKLIKTRAPHIRCSHDAIFLLQFLRVAKFSQLEALKRLENYLSFFTTMSNTLQDTDLDDVKLQNFYNTQYIIPLGYDNEGHRVVIFRLGAFDPDSKDYDKTSVKKALTAFLMYENYNENSSVNGYKALMDCSGFQLKHQMFWTLGDLKENSHFYNGTFPYRWQNLLLYNYNSFFLVVYHLIYPFLKQKIKDRIVMCGDNLEKIYDRHIPKHLFPEEYLPDDYDGPNNGTMSELVDKMKLKMMSPEIKRRIKNETGEGFRVDETKRLRDDVPLQSFRKLNVE